MHFIWFKIIMDLFVGFPSDPCKLCLPDQSPCERAALPTPAENHKEEEKEVRKGIVIFLIANACVPS